MESDVVRPAPAGSTPAGIPTFSSASYCLVQVAGTPLAGDGTRHSVRFLGRTTIGRGAPNDIAFAADALEISRKHAELEVTAGTATIADLGSRNGTFVNGERLSAPRRLNAGDSIRLGERGPELRFEIAQPAFPSGPVPGGTPERRDVRDGGSVVRNSHVIADMLPMMSPNQSSLVARAWPYAVGLTLFFVALLFAAFETPSLFNAVLGIGIGVALLLLVSHFTGRWRPWWLLLAVALPMEPLVRYTWLGDWERNLGGLCTATPGMGIFERILGCTLAVGVFEEFLKILPVAVLAFVALQYPVTSPWRSILAVRGPLDGLFLGAVSGLGFALCETLLPGGYVPAIASRNSTLGLEVEIPRLIDMVLGHVAWSGYVGYALGLVLMDRNQLTMRSLAGAFILASALHGTWDAAGGGYLGLFVLFFVAVFSFMLLIGAIDRAKRVEARGVAAGTL